eukprot:CAMPEP_0117540958 /NCGR_PEP_ID=MMETSP0784-20121206/43767_1 /TAXON_ID=39447 /ORGANISM="" /LENGTH=55 /DNA_ID=CAMNT_0005337629 /DNA_START=912 /DNA_END=1076 /DNA_ORIENTATION=+
MDNLALTSFRACARWANMQHAKVKRQRADDRHGAHPLHALVGTDISPAAAATGAD